MALDTLQQIVDGIKEDGQAGEVGNYADTVARQILRHFNKAAVAFWELNDWDWGKTEGTLSVPASTITALPLPATVGRLLSLGFQGQPGVVDITTEREYRKWRKLQDGVTPSGNPITTTGGIYAAVNNGRDASGNLQYLFVNPPSQDTTLEYVGKTRLNPLAYTMAQLAADVANPNFAYFPDEVQPILYDWAMGRFLRAIKDARSDGILASVQGRLDVLKGTQRTEPAERAVTRPPDYLRYVNRKRGGRSVV